jgi:hypothetical protein
LGNKRTDVGKRRHALVCQYFQPLAPLGDVDLRMDHLHLQSAIMMCVMQCENHYAYGKHL